MGNGNGPEPDFVKIYTEKLGDLLHSHFRPADDKKPATQMLTTEQLWAIIEEHSPEIIPKAFFRQAMLALGYQEQFIGDRFVWLLRAV